VLPGSRSDDLPTALDEHVDPSPDAPSRRRPSWSQMAGFACAAVVVGALVRIAWVQHDQDRVARQQACILDAQTRGLFPQSGDGTLNPPLNLGLTVGIGRCLPDGLGLLATLHVIVPNVVTGHLAVAMNTLIDSALVGKLVKGPSGSGASVTDQTPPAGTVVSGGTVVQLTTGPAAAR
jgi:hypothetical protein